MNSFVLSVFLLLSLIIQSECGCYENWSRCTPQTAFFTGILWKSCAEYCQKCQGRASGSCVKVQNKQCSGGYQCQCSGRSVAKSTNPIDKATCALGL